MLGKGLLHLIPSTCRSMNVKMDKMNLIKITTSVLGNIGEGENSCNHIPDKGMVCRRHKESGPIRKRTKCTKRHFTEEDTGGKSAHGGIGSVTRHQGNANKRHREMAPCSWRRGWHGMPVTPGAGWGRTSVPCTSPVHM